MQVVLVWDSERAAPSLKSLARAADDIRDPLPVLVIDATTHYPGYVCNILNIAILFLNSYNMFIHS